MAKHGGGGGGKIPEVVEGTVKKLLKKAEVRSPSGSRAPGGSGGSGAPNPPGATPGPRAHQHYDGTTKPALTPDGQNLLPASRPAQRPTLGDRLPAGHPDARAQTKLHNILRDNYKGTTSPRGTVGDGRTADAHRWEQRSQQPLGLNPQGKPAWHGEKSQGSVNGLTNWLDKYPDAPQEWRDIAQAELDNLKNSIGGA